MTVKSGILDRCDIDTKHYIDAKRCPGIIFLPTIKTMCLYFLSLQFNE
jgi:hypothetical protein